MADSHSNSRFVYVTYIQTTPQKVWAALFDAEMTRQYWGVHRNVSDWKVGSAWKHVDADDESKVGIVGKVLEAQEPRRLVLTWARPAAAAEAAKTSRLTIEIEPQFDAVKLTVLHEDLDEEMYRGVSTGWPAILSSLKTMLETGAAMPMTTRRWGGKQG